MFKRLYPNLNPTEYDVRLNLNREKLTFSGTATIQGNLPKSTKTVCLHSKDLTIAHASINGVNVDVSHGEFDVLTLTSASELAGSVSIELTFDGVIKSGAMHGVYECVFTHKGQRKQIIATQFESHHARECFPCIDEPEAKAVFKLTLTTPEGEPVLSNMDSKSSTAHAGLLTTVFKPTPQMSTYLLAFAYGDLHSYTETASDGTEVSVWASVAQPISHLKYAAGEGVRYLEFFTEYFQTPYPLGKCDMLSLPDFDAAGMENWGLITYGDLYLMIDPDNSALSNRQIVSMVIAHELSHQWFGNLVTMQWWDDLWLNESFANLMEHIAISEIHKDWHQWEEYTASEVVHTTNRDVFKDVQAVRTDVTNPELISTLFDPAIVYAKGGRLLKALREYIGDTAFKEGLKSYFTEFAYKNTTREDLWAHLAASSNLDVASFMNPWLDRSGMPKITVVQDDDVFTVSQKRFLLDGHDDSSIWPVPLLASSDSAPKLLDSTSMTFKSDALPVLNQNGSGHYITLYSGDQINASLVKLLHSHKLTPEAKIVLFNDYLLLSKAGDLSMPTVLDMVINNRGEERANVLSLMNLVLATSRQLISGDTITEKALKNVQAELYVDNYKELGWTSKTSDTPNDLHMRSMAVSAQLIAESPDAIDTACKLYNESKSDLSKLPADLRSVILTSVVRTHSQHQDVIKNLLSVYSSTNSPDLQQDICTALTSTNHSADVAIFIDQAIGKGGTVRAQDFTRWIAYLAGNTDTREGIWAFVESNWGYIKDLTSKSKSYDYVPLYMARSLNTESWLNRFRAFFEPKLNEVTLERNIHVATGDITARVAWRKREQNAVTSWTQRNTLS